MKRNRLSISAFDIEHIADFSRSHLYSLRFFWKRRSINPVLGGTGGASSAQVKLLRRSSSKDFRHRNYLYRSCRSNRRVSFNCRRCVINISRGRVSCCYLLLSLLHGMHTSQREYLLKQHSGSLTSETMFNDPHISPLCTHPKNIYGESKSSVQIYLNLFKGFLNLCESSWPPQTW